MKKAAVFFSFLLLGCTSIDSRVEGFPQDLTIVEHRKSFIEVQSVCWKYLPLHYKLLGGFTLACAEINLEAKRCDVYLMHDAEEWTLAHELEHCRGGDHNGQLQEYLDKQRGIRR